jgi:NodT family efflux transporter outer membrane factor (OMF) lipoprotein
MALNPDSPVNVCLRQPSYSAGSFFHMQNFSGKLGRVLASLIVLVFLVSGCTVGPDFIRPDVEMEAEWMEKGDPRFKTGTEDITDWWTVFNDPVLNKLIETSYLQNLDLQIAALRILEARAQLGIAVGFQYPQTQDMKGGASANQISDNAANDAQANSNYYDYQVGFDAAWEVDFWGRFRRGVESSGASLSASMANYDDILVSLTAEVARTYVVIRTFEQRRDIARENIRNQMDSLQLAELRFNDGVATKLDVVQAMALLKQTEALIPRLEISIRQARNGLAVLLGLLPVDVLAMIGEPMPIPTAAAEVAVGIPAELLRRRPDIRFAELQAAAQSAKIGVAESDLYPRFSLVGSIGLQSSDNGGNQSNNANFSDLFSSDSITYFVGPSFQWPILNYGRIKNNVRVQDARFQQLVTNYQNTVLQAAQEVEDAMVGFLFSQDETLLLFESVENYKMAVDLSLIQYQEGEASYQRVVDSQRFLTQQADTLASSTGSVAINLIAMYKALGGGWELRLGKDLIPADTVKEMQQRTDWGDLLPQEALPKDLDPPPTGEAQPLFNKPDF